MGCHGVPPSIETRLRLERRDDQLVEIRRKLAAKKAAKFQPRVRAKRRPGLTAKDRAALLRDHGPDVKTWIDSLEPSDKAS